MDTPFIGEPKRIPLLLRLGIVIAERVTGKRMLPARLLTWYPKAALSSGVLEALVAHRDAGLSARLLQLIRMRVSFRASCAFCIDMNASEFAAHGISEDELTALQGSDTLEACSSFTERERLALRYVDALTLTPIAIGAELVAAMQREFSERQFVVLATTIAQVNYWTRLIQGLGIPPAGFSAECALLNLDRYRTVR